MDGHPAASAGRPRERHTGVRAGPWARQGRALQVVDLVGEPGVGKTRLLYELARAAREARFVALSGRAAEFEQELPLAVFVDVLDDHLERALLH